METSKRIGAVIEDTTNLIRNWAIYLLLLVVIFGISFYIAGISFAYWQNSKPKEFRIDKIIYEQLYVKGWKPVYTNYDPVKRQAYYDYYKSYYEKSYGEPARKQIRNYPAKEKKEYEKQIDESIDGATDAAVSAYLESHAAPLPASFLKKLLISTFAPLFFWGIIIFFLRAPLRDFRPFDKGEKLHGDAKWATEKDIKGANLRSKTGLIIGRDNRGYLIAPGFQHCLLFAPTGSGKGVGIVIPNLLFWEDSLFVHDIKLENYEITSGYRKQVMKQDVYLWNPASPDGVTHCYNPFDWIS